MGLFDNIVAPAKGASKVPLTGLFDNIQPQQSLQLSEPTLTGLFDNIQPVPQNPKGNPWAASVKGGLARAGADIARIPGAALSIGSELAAASWNIPAPENMEFHPSNLLPKGLTNPQIAQDLDKIAQENDYGMSQFGDDNAITLMGQGRYADAARWIGHGTLMNAPNTVMAFAGGGLGLLGKAQKAELVGKVVLGAMGAMAASRARQEAPEGMDPLMRDIYATTIGGVEAGTEMLGTYGIVRKWGQALAKSYGPGMARTLIKDAGKSIASSFMQEGSEEILAEFGNAFADYAFGTKDDPFAGISSRAASAFILGGIAGGAMGGGMAGVLTNQNLTKINRMEADLPNVPKYEGMDAKVKVLNKEISSPTTTTGQGAGLSALQERWDLAGQVLNIKQQAQDNAGYMEWKTHKVDQAKERLRATLDKMKLKASTVNPNEIKQAEQVAPGEEQKLEPFVNQFVTNATQRIKETKTQVSQVGPVDMNKLQPGFREAVLNPESANTSLEELQHTITYDPKNKSGIGEKLYAYWDLDGLSAKEVALIVLDGFQGKNWDSKMMQLKIKSVQGKNFDLLDVPDMQAALAPIMKEVVKEAKYHMPHKAIQAPTEGGKVEQLRISEDPSKVYVYAEDVPNDYDKLRDWAKYPDNALWRKFSQIGMLKNTAPKYALGGKVSVIIEQAAWDKMNKEQRYYFSQGTNIETISADKVEPNAASIIKDMGQFEQAKEIVREYFNNYDIFGASSTPLLSYQPKQTNVPADVWSALRIISDKVMKDQYKPNTTIPKNLMKGLWDQAMIAEVGESVRPYLQELWDTRNEAVEYAKFKARVKSSEIPDRRAGMTKWDVPTIGKMLKDYLNNKQLFNIVGVDGLKSDRNQRSICAKAVRDASPHIEVDADKLALDYQRYLKGELIGIDVKKEGVVDIPDGMDESEFQKFVYEHERAHLVLGLDGSSVDENVASYLALNRIGRNDLARLLEASVPKPGGKMTTELMRQMAKMEADKNKFNRDPIAHYMEENPMILETPSRRLEDWREEIGDVKIISGGQTGADMGGLEGARAAGLETGGVAPSGFKTEKGMNIKLKDYGLKASTSSDYNVRTKQNVLDSDGTVIFGNVASSGSANTIRFAKEAGKPVIINPTAEQLRNFAKDKHIINIAGNRESRNPGLQVKVASIVREAFALTGSSVIGGGVFSPNRENVIRDLNLWAIRSQGGDITGAKGAENIRGYKEDKTVYGKGESSKVPVGMGVTQGLIQEDILNSLDPEINRKALEQQRIQEDAAIAQMREEADKEESPIQVEDDVVGQKQKSYREVGKGTNRYNSAEDMHTDIWLDIFEKRGIPKPQFIDENFIKQVYELVQQDPAVLDEVIAEAYQRANEPFTDEEQLELGVQADFKRQEGLLQADIVRSESMFIQYMTAHGMKLSEKIISATTDILLAKPGWETRMQEDLPSFLGGKEIDLLSRKDKWTVWKVTEGGKESYLISDAKMQADYVFKREAFYKQAGLDVKNKPYKFNQAIRDAWNKYYQVSRISNVPQTAITTDPTGPSASSVILDSGFTPDDKDIIKNFNPSQLPVHITDARISDEFPSGPSEQDQVNDRLKIENTKDPVSKAFFQRLRNMRTIPWHWFTEFQKAHPEATAGIKGFGERMGVGRLPSRDIIKMTKGINMASDTELWMVEQIRGDIRSYLEESSNGQYDKDMGRTMIAIGALTVSDPHNPDPTSSNSKYWEWKWGTGVDAETIAKYTPWIQANPNLMKRILLDKHGMDVAAFQFAYDTGGDLTALQARRQAGYFPFQATLSFEEMQQAFSRRGMDKVGQQSFFQKSKESHTIEDFEKLTIPHGLVVDYDYASLVARRIAEGEYRAGITAIVKDLQHWDIEGNGKMALVFPTKEGESEKLHQQIDKGGWGYSEVGDYLRWMNHKLPSGAEMIAYAHPALAKELRYLFDGGQYGTVGKGWKQIQNTIRQIILYNPFGIMTDIIGPSAALVGLPETLKTFFTSFKNQEGKLANTFAGTKTEDMGKPLTADRIKQLIERGAILGREAQYKALQFGLKEAGSYFKDKASKSWVKETLEFVFLEHFGTSKWLWQVTDNYTMMITQKLSDNFMKEHKLQGEEGRKVADYAVIPIVAGAVQNLPSRIWSKDLSKTLGYMMLAKSYTTAGLRVATGAIPLLQKMLPIRMLQHEADNIWAAKFQQKQYAKMLTVQFLGLMMVGTLLNLMFAGKLPWDNDEGHKFDVELPYTKSNGEKLYMNIPMFRQFENLIRMMPKGIANKIGIPYEGDTGQWFQNKLDPTLKEISAQLFNRDTFTGEDITFSGATWAENIENRIWHALGRVTPSAGPASGKFKSPMEIALPVLLGMKVSGGGVGGDFAKRIREAQNKQTWDRTKLDWIIKAEAPGSAKQLQAIQQRYPTGASRKAFFMKQANPRLGMMKKMMSLEKAGYDVEE